MFDVSQLPAPLRSRYYQLLFKIKLARFTPILVYQMGKVGSLSIYNSLKKQYPGVVLHTHRFRPGDVDWKLRSVYDRTFLKKGPINVISPVREPISRNVSAFFQNFEKSTGVAYENATFSTPELKKNFLASFRHEVPLEWFDKSIKDVFGIDVYATPFPASGFTQYSRENIRLLVLRMEIDDRDKVNAIQDFLGLDSFTLERTNVGEDKVYAATYKEFQNTVQLPRDYIERMCESKYSRHFYTQSEIDKASSKWGGVDLKSESGTVGADDFKPVPEL